MTWARRESTWRSLRGVGREVWPPGSRPAEAVEADQGPGHASGLTMPAALPSDGLLQSSPTFSTWQQPVSWHLPGGQPEAHHRHPGHLGRCVEGVQGPQVGTAAAEAVPGLGAGAVPQEAGGGRGGGGHEAPWACQAAGGPGAQTSGGAGCLRMSTAPPGSAQQFMASSPVRGS
ncbi:hypothetical protein HaLaN_01143 [Haematococcus lacustris]|uniref:Uncharacterized protein n=1 Tax=Haematococcus lacustris TaxID=44745 RepID=A0A699YF88_HAELA|nr:hypothetical protein HaLaN_01143 [Haematococcus lacustris]